MRKPYIPLAIPALMVIATLGLVGPTLYQRMNDSTPGPMVALKSDQLEVIYNTDYWLGKAAERPDEWVAATAYCSFHNATSRPNCEAVERARAMVLAHEESRMAVDLEGLRLDRLEEEARRLGIPAIGDSQ